VKGFAAIAHGAVRFNSLTLRERLLIVGAATAALLTLWRMLLMEPLEIRRKAFTADAEALRNGTVAMSQAIEAGRAADPTTLAQRQIEVSERALAVVDSKLETSAAGLLPPQRMVEVVQDVLRQRHDVRLISLRTEAVVSLSHDVDGNSAPYLHPVELIVEGRYLDILDYLRALERLHWRLYWMKLELDGAHYPRDRVRLEVGTLSLDRPTLGF
jgi:MSHA biogenesis protein MshJ